MTAYARWVTRVAQALHDDCELEWQAIAVVDPSRAIKKHRFDAHYGKAHDLVRRLRLTEAESLNVERLASALAVGLNCGGCDKDQRHAERIAAEYERLGAMDPALD